ncbi:MAG: hypothetical protein ABIH23_21895 [bacterium]
MTMRPSNQPRRQIGIFLTIASLVGFGFAIVFEPAHWINDYIKMSVTVVSFVAFGAGMVILYHCRVWPFK